MFASLRTMRKPFARLAIGLVTALSVVACGPVALGVGGGGGSGPQVDPSSAVRVALLVPKGASGGGGLVGRSLENAAKLAVADLQGAQIDLQVYDTQGTPGGAARAAESAVAAGAQVVLGPLYTQSVSAVVPIVASRNINVLSFSNNTAVAGGNVFVLGQTFSNVANRLISFARRQGRTSVAVVHAGDVAGIAGRDAIVGAARSSGMSVATVQSYDLSQQGIVSAGPRIATAIQQTGADTVFLTANVDSDLPLISTALPENGVSPEQFRYLGLTRWNALPQVLSLPGLQNGLFTLPDVAVQSAFEARYSAAYGSAPHPLAGLAYDAVQAVGSLLAQGRGDALSKRALTQGSGFAGAYGVFRLLPDGTNQRALAVAQIQNSQVVVLDPAPKRFGASGF
ncbi:penicillin-binding protein activator [Maribius pontilimi]|uniref:Penicillin-binding protein activator n=1 Tax=Palleronia pontilimi TaxID=1964209 RepID=A0A934MDC2_9RHOB|nr:penicillin-binding protein activator [Palleronia pontilimi]MBJ3763365.1 penicillin-binding protein activator [Palleronia pontilimi]